MSPFFLSLILSFVVIGALTFIGLVGGIGMFSGSVRGRGIRALTTVVSVVWIIGAAMVGGSAAFGGAMLAAVLVFVFFFLRQRLR
ncbi:MAG: hypothetical protein JNN26_25265 [Candidatus Obscuribacter sp.]|nr:hypothetical protein [Candidatus Obscuribacter sp.]